MKRWMLMIWGVLLFASCYDDKGNYDYVDIGDLTITGIESDRWYELFAFSDTLYIPVEILSNRYVNGEMPYTYEWKLEGANDKTHSGDTVLDYTLSREKDLRIVPMMNAGDYFGFFIVTDTILGLREKVDFFVRLRTSTSEGWMILCEQEGKARLDWISNISETEDRIYRDLWGDLDVDLGKPFGISFSNYSSWNNRYVFVENGVFNLDKDDAHVGEDNDIRWRFGEQPDRIQGAANLIALRNTFSDLLITRDKDLYKREMPKGIYEFPINRTDEGERYDVAPFFGMACKGNLPDNGVPIVLYDETNRRFLELPDDNWDFLPRTMTFTGGEQDFNAWTGRDMLFMDWTTDNYVFAVLQEPNTDDLYVYGMKVDRTGNTRTHYSLLKRPNSDKITRFAIHSMHKYLFYSTDKGEIFRYELSYPEDEAVKVLSFPGETITALKVNKFMLPINQYAPWELNRRDRLVVGSYITAEAEQGNDLDCGIMRTYDVPDLGRPLDEKPVKFHDKLGKIVDIVYRERGN